MNRKALLIGVALAALPGLSGCVAAIPAVAALAMGGSQMDKKDGDKPVTVADLPPPKPAAASTPAPTPVATPAPAAKPAPVAMTEKQAPEIEPPSAPIIERPVQTARTVDAPPPVPLVQPDAPTNVKPLPVRTEPPVAKPVERPVVIARVDVPESQAPKVTTPKPVAAAPVAPALPEPASPAPARSEALPPPAPKVTPSLGTSRLGPELLKPSTSPGYDKFASFVEDRSNDFNMGRTAKSVVFNPDSALEAPTFAQCGEKPLAIILDLDNNAFTEAENADLWRGAIDPAAGVKDAVNEARRLDVAVFYMSSQPATSGIRIAAALNEAGLGPAEPGVSLWLKGERGLERKDLLRQVISRHYCVVAMAGDKKSDFADLYDFLRDPNTPAVKTLDPLFNAGWFMLPNPVVAANPVKAK